jgi:hypothetical protein
MSDDAISRQEAITALRKDIMGGLNYEYILNKLPVVEPQITLESAIDFLHKIGWMQEHDRILTEFAKPQKKRGYWIPQLSGFKDSYKCSACKKIAVMPVKPDPYCPNCGAKMDGGE